LATPPDALNLVRIALNLEPFGLPYWL